ncbi:phosphoglucomutase/phosphomannomutase alpha/beta/alpha domain I [Allomuricauda ruestringensis DSM 13258]|uniref:Phosphoglucomutase/phosphomannomutase alpha/beta/alpha domain I n=1 Tax=Allomuricauda ruestringensis (strain DSM 13258 / CIP 107369 / LMG 19739 / B1) TaxID=886377 RepID=G2PQY1_ALLRU|nr:phospho-sugar mutase [Allomuricauda ruestringensis]AEM69145.1 phosphoglucomutase/phosphomannomutase alpha/beta/alpha domain I [Allomuricauda ruestringensis DSM 13258]
MDSITATAQTWLTDFFDEDTKKEIKHLIENDPEELKERFYKDLEFGTGGMRGVMGVGTNRINKYTLGKNTQGLSNYLKKSYTDNDLRVVIAYDCRHNSKSLAKTVAEVFSANGIRVHLFSDLRTTPELSYAVKHIGCHAGIVLTASHNPPEYNGYKVYWADGGQIVPPQDGEIIAEINALSFEDIKFDKDENLIHLIDEDVDEAFFDASVKNGSFDAKGKDNFKIVFTSLHGTSITAIPEVLKRAGYKNVTIIEEQAKPDGDFPTVESPNPEEPEALSMAIKKAEEIGADMVVGTDPDSDRLGIAVRNLDGKIELLNGNQTMVLMTKFLLDQYKEEGFKGNEFIATTIVSTPMMQQMAKSYGVEFKTALTGFKWIGKMIKDFPNSRFIGGGEESFGYMVGDFVRDKDAVTATLLACEIAASAKANGSSFYKDLIDAYVEFGFYKEKLISITKKGMSGAEEIKQMLKDFKENPVNSVQGSKLLYIEDYNTSIVKNVQTGEEFTLHLPKSNVLIYETEDGTRIAARPSGTEPKVKFYISTNAKLDKAADYKSVNSQLDTKIEGIISELNL